MKPAPFEYFRPADVAEAIALLAEHGDGCKVLAGGQSLVPAMNFRLVRPAILVDINDLDALGSISADASRLSIGALTRHAAFHRPVVEGPLGLLLSQVARHIAHYPIRQRGTFGGSLAHADPASEWCLVATTLGAEMVATSTRGQRAIGSAAFFKGTFSTALAADELLVDIRLPAMGPDWRFGFFEFSRRAGDYALGMALAAVQLSDGVVRDARLGIGAVAQRAIRLQDLERQLIGERLSASAIDAVARAASASIQPTGDIHASPEYRRDLITTAVKRALAEAGA